MKRLDVLTPLGEEMLMDLPPVLAGDPDYVAVIHCHAREMERIAAALEQVRAELNPVTAVAQGLDGYELLLLLPSGSGLTVAARRARIVDRYASLSADPSTRAFMARLLARLGGGWSYLENQPAAQTLRFQLPWAVGTPEWNEAIRIIREEAPSEQALSFVSALTFRLDESQLDQDSFGT